MKKKTSKPKAKPFFLRNPSLDVDTLVALIKRSGITDGKELRQCLGASGMASLLNEAEFQEVIDYARAS